MIGIYNSSISRSVFEILTNYPTYDVIRGGLAPVPFQPRSQALLPVKTASNRGVSHIYMTTNNASAMKTFLSL